MDIKDKLDRVIEIAYSSCSSKLFEDGKGMSFVDTHEKREISAHYGASHMAVAMLLNKDEAAVRMLRGVLDRWQDAKAQPDFHNDFNNFALCLAYELLEQSGEEQLREEVKNTVISTPDSRHFTVNWLPMRWYVNNFRYKITSDEKYKEVCDACREMILQACYEDGFVDDRLPKGISFNLQYDVATIATLKLLDRECGDVPDLESNIEALLAAVAPDGDINYLGRGVNQIFAWGPWLYILSSSGQWAELDRALDYLSDKIRVMFEKDNLMLNPFMGSERYLWWDYHYASVYQAHFLMWALLSRRDLTADRKKGASKKSSTADSGMHIDRQEDRGVVIFDGRREYISEQGKSVALLWTKKSGIIYKGGLGPWQHPFGTKYTYVDPVIRNRIGLYQITLNRDIAANRILRHLFKNMSPRAEEKICPLFEDICLGDDRGAIVLEFANPKGKEVFFNLPVFEEALGKNEIELTVDGEKIPLCETMKIKTQYGYSCLLQSRVSRGRRWVLKIV